MDLETRTCPSCKKPFKALASSAQVYCNHRCKEFRNGKRNKFTDEELGRYRRFGILSPSKRFPAP